MKDAELFLRQLVALRHQLSGVVATIDTILELATREHLDIEPECEHPIPLRVPMPTMGHADRFRCRGCEAVVEG